MAMIALQSRSTGRMVAVNTATINTVTAIDEANDDPDGRRRMVRAPSQVFLSVWHQGTQQDNRYVPIDRDGKTDASVTDPDDAVRDFCVFVFHEERSIRRPL